MGLLDFLKEAACDVGIHSWSDWFYQKTGDCTQIRQCVRPLCKKVKDDRRTVHVFGEWHYPEAESCRSIRECSRCGHIEEETQHTWEDWQYEREGNCLQVRTCSRCHDKDKRTEHVLDGWRYDGPKSCNQLTICIRCNHKKTRHATKMKTTNDGPSGATQPPLTVACSSDTASDAARKRLKWGSRYINIRSGYKLRERNLRDAACVVGTGTGKV